MKKFIEYAKSKGVKSIDVDTLCLINDFLKEQESKQSSLNGVVASLPTTNEAKLKLKQAVENIFKDNEIVEKRQYSLGFRHCYNWLKIEQIKSKG